MRVRIRAGLGLYVDELYLPRQRVEGEENVDVLLERVLSTSFVERDNVHKNEVCRIRGGGLGKCSDFAKRRVSVRGCL